MTSTTNDVEPTTSATDVLRRMLDERGVEWWQSVNMLGCVFTRWYSPLFSDEVVAMENGDGELELFSHLMTPEQAIAATLGHYNTGRYVGLRQGEYWERTENGDYYCGGCGWKVTDHDSYCPECGGALHEYALGTGTCHITDNGPWGYPYVCSACGASFDPDVNNGEVNFCPNCGRRIVDPTTNYVDMEVEQ